MAAAAAASPAAAAAACCFVLYGRSAPLTSIGRTDGLAADCIGVRCPPRLAAVSTWLHWELSNWGHAALPTARVRPAAGGFPGRPAAQRRLRPPPSPAGRRGGHCKHLLRHDPHLRRAGRLGLGLVHRRPARHRGHLGSQGHLRLPAVSAWEGKLRRRERLRSLPCPPGRGAETAANGPGEQGVRLHSMMRTWAACCCGLASGGLRRLPLYEEGGSSCPTCGQGKACSPVPALSSGPPPPPSCLLQAPPRAGPGLGAADQAHHADVATQRQPSRRHSRRRGARAGCQAQHSVAQARHHAPRLRSQLLERPPTVRAHAAAAAAVTRSQSAV